MFVFCIFWVLFGRMTRFSLPEFFPAAGFLPFFPLPGHKKALKRHASGLCIQDFLRCRFGFGLCRLPGQLLPQGPGCDEPDDREGQQQYVDHQHHPRGREQGDLQQPQPYANQNRLILRAGMLKNTAVNAASASTVSAILIFELFVIIVSRLLSGFPVLLL